MENGWLAGVPYNVGVPVLVTMELKATGQRKMVELQPFLYLEFSLLFLWCQM